MDCPFPQRIILMLRRTSEVGEQVVQRPKRAAVGGGPSNGCRTVNVSTFFRK